MINSLNDGDSKYLAARKSLDQLRESTINPTDIYSEKFGIKVTQKRHNFEYGTHHFYQIEICENGSYQDISINGLNISYLVSYNTDFYRSRPIKQFYGYMHFKVATNSGNILDIMLEEIYSSNLATSIVAAIIFISEISDIEALNEIWHFLFDERKIEVGHAITLLTKSKDISQRIIEKYPLMKGLLQDAINRRINIIKNDLSELTFLK